REPDDVVASRRAGLDVKRRGALDGVRIRNWLRRAAEDVGRLDLGGEAGGVGRDDDARKLDGTLRIQDDAYARLALLEVAVLLGGPERGAVAVRNFRRFLGMLALVGSKGVVRIDPAQRNRPPDRNLVLALAPAERQKPD